jgi:26S proteasome regulatory subunit N5
LPAAKGIDFIANQPERYNILIRRLLEHNLQIFGEYFSRVSVHKISTLLGVAKDNLEEITASMVVKKQLFAKINRINQIISFRKKEDIQEQLEKTNRNVEEMLEKIDNTCHLIHKENLKYSIK